jgi:predicted RNase H-like HicB family nuclease
MSNESKIAHFKSILPQRITIQFTKDESGVWARVIDLPHCYTQASNVNELPELITDLVFTHFEIPKDLRKDLGEYIPLSDDHIRLEEAFRRLIDIGTRTQAGEEVEQIFTRAQAVLA